MKRQIEFELDKARLTYEWRQAKYNRIVGLASQHAAATEEVDDAYYLLGMARIEVLRLEEALETQTLP